MSISSQGLPEAWCNVAMYPYSSTRSKTHGKLTWLGHATPALFFLLEQVLSASTVEAVSQSRTHKDFLGRLTPTTAPTGRRTTSLR